MIHGIWASVLSLVLSAVLTVADVAPMLKFFDAKTLNSSGTFVHEIKDGAFGQEEVQIKKVEGNYIVQADWTNLEDPKMDFVMQTELDGLAYQARLLVVDKGVYTDVNTIISILKAAMQVFGGEYADAEEMAQVNEAIKLLQSSTKDVHQMVKLVDLNETEYKGYIEEFTKEKEAGKEFFAEVFSIFKDVYKGFTHSSIVKTEDGVKVVLDRKASADLLDALFERYAANRMDVLPRLQKAESKLYEALGYTDVESQISLDTPLEEEEAAVKQITEEMRNGKIEYFDDYKLTYETSIKDDVWVIKADMSVIKGGQPIVTSKWETKNEIREIVINAPSQSMSIDELLNMLQ